jgi:hypothetical protein
MVVHIAPIGRETAHVIEWLRSGSVQKIYLLHSRKTAKVDFPKKARDLEKQIKKMYPGVEIIKRVIENAFNLDDTQDAISEIFYYETKDNKVQNQEITINVTGGTNVQGAAAVLSAFKHGTKADYILDRRINKNLDSYIVPLPIPSIGIVNVNKTQQEVLQLIFEGRFLRYEQEKVTDEITKKLKTITKPVYDVKATGKITNIQLLETMPIRDKKTGEITGYHDESKDYGKKQKRSTKKGSSKIGAVVKELERKGYIIIHPRIPALEKMPLGGGRYGPDKKISISKVMYEITPAGRRQAKDEMMDKE